MKKWISISLIALTSLMIGGCSENKSEKANITNESTIESDAAVSKKSSLKVKWPYYEIAKDGEVKGHLLGVLHIGKPEMYPFPENIITDLEQSENFITEVSVDQKEASLDEEKNLALMTTSVPLTTDMSEASRKKYQDILASYDFTEANVATLSRYGVYMMLFASAMSEDPTIDPQVLSENGVDAQLTTYHLKNKQQTNIPLETTDFQTETMAKAYNLPEDINQWVDTLLTKEDNAKTSSNIGAIQSYIDGKLDTSGTTDEQNEIINHSRNLTWSEKLPTYLEKKDQSFIAVGAAHLIGDKGLVELLKKAGYEVKLITFD